MKLVGIAILFLTFFCSIFFISHKPITQNTSTLHKASGTMTTKTGMKITSPAFGDHQPIPSKYTCDGASVNPPLSFNDVPKNAKSLVLLMDDPDVPKTLLSAGVFDHWVIYNIDPTVTKITENSVPPGVQGVNGAGSEKYTGPCPPDREHRYFFKLYALDATLDFIDPSKVTKQMVLDHMRGHIIEQVELVGLYHRKTNPQ